MFSREKKRPPEKEKIKFLVSFRIFVILSAKKNYCFLLFAACSEKRIPGFFRLSFVREKLIVLFSVVYPKEKEVYPSLSPFACHLSSV